MKRVSVVMACFNPQSDRLQLSIRSILNQSYKNMEIIIVDDGSDYPVEELIRQMFSDDRIKIFRIEHSGLGAALNYGIRHSEGDYIARLDDDDVMVSTRIEKQVEYLNHCPEVSCVGTWHYDKLNNKYYPHRKFPVDHENIIKSLLHFRFSLAHTTLMFRRTSFDKIGGYRILGGGQDLDLELQLGGVGRLANIPEYLNYYTMSASGLGTVNPRKYQAYLFALNEVKDKKMYLQYADITERSIAKLKGLSINNNNNLRERFKRYCLISRIKLFGNKFNIANL